MPLTLIYEVDGVGTVTHTLLGFAERALEPYPVLKGIAAAMRGIERDLFAAEGYGTWPPLSPVTIERKGHDRILFETGDLEASLTEESSGDHFEVVTGNVLLFGTSDPKAGYHRTGTANMPARDPLQLREQDLRQFTKAVQAWLVGSDRAEFGTPSFANAALFA